MTAHLLTGNERHRIGLYFFDPRLRYGLTLVLAGLVLIELPLGKLLLLCGLTWLGAGLALAAQRPSDEELDQLLSSDLDTLVENATRSLDRSEDEVQVPALALLSPSPLVAESPSIISYRWRTGRDGRRRSPVNRAVVLIPMEDQLGIYTCDQNSVTGRISSISVEEHHYRDIVSLRMEGDLAPAEVPPQRSGLGSRGVVPSAAQRLSLDLTNGRRVAVLVASAWRQPGAGGGALGPSEVEKTLTAIRALMRDHR